ncbi:YdgH/BhsA/McbA family protein [Klebsiella aerogenes]|uniref:DUF1471 domain-containing protein n=1 Tax=Klebsiella aerogenes TaxID=548 RepID=UPI0013A60D2E|nr:DUF1471 domain-containing protein [Klebsiella aerogenes]HCB2860445.1 DUF1471 domain-containing protein [Klebsiella aerogenes]HCB2864782.1 DUF1471 domain-containing protein [Klebsiella aerogenes]HCB2881608.1 DUF1471 domain-containing protein [Klebsiella aerogenes]HCB3345845.1 DUF1471 domain-containing protein [Klebsiella aerogenes]HCM1812513.1 DUF1471 domain-containing protein [Klebsiella aerogenes]
MNAITCIIIAGAALAFFCRWLPAVKPPQSGASSDGFTSFDELNAFLVTKAVNAGASYHRIVNASGNKNCPVSADA